MGARKMELALKFWAFGRREQRQLRAIPFKSRRRCCFACVPGVQMPSRSYFVGLDIPGPQLWPPLYRGVGFKV